MEKYHTDDVLGSPTIMIGNDSPQLCLIDTGQITTEMQAFITENGLKNDQGFFGACWRTNNLQEFESNLTKQSVKYQMLGRSIHIPPGSLHGINTFIIE